MHDLSGMRHFRRMRFLPPENTLQAFSPVFPLVVWLRTPGTPVFFGQQLRRAGCGPARLRIPGFHVHHPLEKGYDSTRLRIPKAARLSRRFSRCGSTRLGIFPIRARIGNGARYGSSHLRIRRPSAARPSTVWVWLRGEYAWGDARTSDALSSAVPPSCPAPAKANSQTPFGRIHRGGEAPSEAVSLPPVLRFSARHAMLIPLCAIRARVAELVDALDLESSGFPWGFNSPLSHQKA